MLICIIFLDVFDYVIVFGVYGVVMYIGFVLLVLWVKWKMCNE